MLSAHQLEAKNHALKTLLTAAYNVSPVAISGVPEWSEADHFEMPFETALRAHQRERVPVGPPIDVLPGARTVLAGKGSLRRAPLRRALARSAPFRPDSFAMGGSGGNTRRPSDYSKRRNYLKPTTQNSTGLDKVAPYQFSEGRSNLSTTSVSTDPLVASSLSPNCS